MTGIDDFTDWEDKGAEYLGDIQLGRDSQNAAPDSEKERREVYKLKRPIVKTLVERVTIDRDRNLKVVFRLDT